MNETVFSVGDVLKIKDLDALTESLGDKYNAMCGWSTTMDKDAGGEYEVKKVSRFRHPIPHYSYQFKETGYYWFSEDTIEISKSPDPECFSISFDEIMSFSKP